MMQKLLSVSALFAALFVSISCQKEIIGGGDSPEKEKAPVIVAEIAKPFDTKTCMDGTLDAPKICWQKGDEIKIIFGGYRPDTTVAVYVVTKILPEDSSKCVFEYKSGYVAKESDWLEFAYYPASDAKGERYGEGSKHAVAVTVPAVQYYTSSGKTGTNAGSFGRDAFPMLGKPKDNSHKYVKDTLQISFHNVYGILQLNLKPDDTNKKVSRIDVYCHDAVCGPVEFQFSGDSITSRYMNVPGGPYNYIIRQVTLAAVSPVTLSESGTAFYIVIPGGDTVKRIAVSTNDGFYCANVSQTADKAVVISRSHIKSLKACTVAERFSKITYPEAPLERPVMEQGLIYAPVNCGFKEKIQGTTNGFVYGKLYQWNRKYGQGRAGMDESGPKFYDGKVPLSEGNMDIAKDTFFRVGQSQCWYHTPAPSKSDVWSDDYNPCPEGWGLPTMKDFNRLRVLQKQAYSEGGTQHNQSGVLFGTDSCWLFLPFVRIRCEDGVMDTTEYKQWGDYGCYWSKSGSVSGSQLSTESTAERIVFTSTDTYDQLPISRACGIAVRCVYTGEL